MSLEILPFRRHPSFNDNPQPDNPIVMKEHKCSGCGKEWKEPIHKYGGTYAFCEECCEATENHPDYDDYLGCVVPLDFGT